MASGQHHSQQLDLNDIIHVLANIVVVLGSPSGRSVVLYLSVAFAMAQEPKWKPSVASNNIPKREERFHFNTTNGNDISGQGEVIIPRHGVADAAFSLGLGPRRGPDAENES